MHLDITSISRLRGSNCVIPTCSSSRGGDYSKLMGLATWLPFLCRPAARCLGHRGLGWLARRKPNSRLTLRRSRGSQKFLCQP